MINATALAFSILVFTPSGGSPATVHQAGGVTWTGLIEKIDGMEITPATGPPISVEKVFSIDWRPVNQDSPSELAVLLRGQGRVRARQIVTDARSARLTLRSGETVSLPLSALLGLLWTPANQLQLDTRLKEWSGPTDRDTILARRGNEQALLEGTVGEIDPEKVRFTLAGQTLDVRLPRVLEVRYAHPSADALARVRVIDQEGNNWPANEVTLAGDRLQATGPSLGQRSWPLDEVARIEWGSARTRYLSDIEPAVLEHRPYFDRSWSVGRDQNLLGGPIRIADQMFTKGIVVHSRTEIVYALIAGEQKFQAMLGIEASAGAAGAARVSIALDDKTLWEGDVRAGEPARSIDLSLAGDSGSRQLRLLVDFGTRADIGDHVAWGDARLTQ